MNFQLQIIGLSIVFFCLSATAQDKADPLAPAPAPTAEIGPTAPPVKDEHFEVFTQPGFIKSLLEFPVYSFYLGAPDLNGAAYVPDFSPRLGVQFGWKDLSVMTSVALPLPADEIERRGNTDQLSFIVSKYWRQYALDVYYQRYKGFYLSSPFTELDSNKPSRYPQLPDAVVSNYGATVYYVLDPGQYSLCAGFSQIEYQNFSGGSWLYSPFYNHVELSTGTTFIQGSDPNAQHSMPSLRSTTLDTLGAGVGYGYTWAQGRRFITAQGSAGLGLQAQQLENVGDDRSSGSNLAVQLNVNLAAGYNYKVYSWGGKFLVNSLLSDVKSTQIDSSLVQGEVFFGGRF